MALSLENSLSAIRSLISGSIAGGSRFLILSLAAIALWGSVLALTAVTRQALDRLAQQQARFHSLLTLASEYSALSPSTARTASALDVPSVFASVSERLNLSGRVNRIAPEGLNQSVEIVRLYASELDALCSLLSSRGVEVLAAELRALPAGTQRLFTLNAVIGPAR